MKHPSVGTTYVLEDKELWGVRSLDKDQYDSSDVFLREGDIVLCVDPDIEVEYVDRWASPYSCAKIEDAPRTMRRRRVWLFEDKLVYDSPIESYRNGGQEDNLMNFLAELGANVT